MSFSFSKEHKKLCECFSPKSESTSLQERTSQAPAESEQLGQSAEQMFILQNAPSFSWTSGQVRPKNSFQPEQEL